MSTWCVFMILVGYMLQDTSQSTCNDQLKTIYVPAGGNVSVPCPKLSFEDAKFDLLQDGEIIYNNTCSLEEDSIKCKTNNIREDVALRENNENKSVSFVLTKVNASSHGIYRCKVKVTFPPPLVTKLSDPGILLLIEGHQCNSVDKNDKAPREQNYLYTWIWITVVVVSSYSIIVTIAAINIWVKLRRADSQSDYMNTKPQATRNRRKKRGLLNPVPRHF